jgi:hypothetical protein
LSSVNLPNAAVINGVAVPAGRLFVPLASIIEDGLGGTVQFIEGNMYEGRPHVIRAFANDIMADFIVGQTFVRSAGTELPLPYGTAPFIGDGTNGTVAGRTYFPVAAIAAVFNLPVNPAGPGGTTVLN